MSVRAALGVALVVITACGETPTAPATSTSTPSTSDLQQIVIKRFLAMSRRDGAAFQATIDQERPVLRRCQTEEFEIAGRQGTGSSPYVLAVEPAVSSYVRAYVQEGNAATRWFFRRDQAGHWVVTEPAKDELGDRVSRTVDRVTYYHWQVDESVIDVIAPDVSAARDRALTEIRQAPLPFSVEIIPTQELAGQFARCNNVTVAYYARAPLPQITLPKLYFAKPGQTASFMRPLLTHEALHWAQSQNVTGTTGGVAWWLVEGWPDYVAGTSSMASIRSAVCRRQVPAYKQMVDEPPRDVGDAPETLGDYYSYANTMVEHVYATLGAAMYWKLYEGYANSGYKVAFQASDQVLASALGTTQERFRADWLARAKKKYC